MACAGHWSPMRFIRNKLTPPTKKPTIRREFDHMDHYAMLLNVQIDSGNRFHRSHIFNIFISSVLLLKQSCHRFTHVFIAQTVNGFALFLRALFSRVCLLSGHSCLLCSLALSSLFRLLFISHVCAFKMDAFTIKYGQMNQMDFFSHSSNECAWLIGFGNSFLSLRTIDSTVFRFISQRPINFVCQWRSQIRYLLLLIWLLSIAFAGFRVSL